ncbi:hypothetical protein D0T49_11915 [Paludibacter sp. 221]|uniref:FISUMP domain-containing protein n=1 Tax=Paludibacter sp. 221 TaxID=2302939 RepID=UPI0013CFBA7E|nr:FISUMP domain-containing protein [Paludibacter sp. 221]NDV47753.1 hypothetical protein [Paludibacter sp. 221]
MNRKQISKFTLALFTMLVVAFGSINAQVTIGADKEPESFSLLEVTGTTGGLRLPQLTTNQRDALTVNGEDLAKGLTIFNTDIDCMETWNGSKWLPNCGDDLSGEPPLIVIHPQSQFITKDNWDTAAATTLKITAAGFNLSYQWFKTDATGTVSTEIAGETKPTFTPTDVVGYFPNIYYCVVYNGYGMVESKRASVVKACDAKRANSKILYFMCHNLGADYTADPFTPAAAIHGAKYKWGVSSPALSQTQDQASAAANPIGTWASTGPTPPATNTPWNMNNANPCPAGWRVPTKGEWDQVIDNNAWTKTNTSWIAGTTNYASGYKVGDNLFLPTTGHRDYSDGALLNRGSHGYYWSSTQGGTTGGYFLLFNSTVQNTSSYRRSLGLVIRCVAE